MSGIFLRAVRECERCPARNDVEIELGERDGQLTGKIHEAVPDGWERKRIQGYGHGSYYVVLCGECSNKDAERE